MKTTLRVTARYRACRRLPARGLSPARQALVWARIRAALATAP